MNHIDKQYSDTEDFLLYLYWQLSYRIYPKYWNTLTPYCNLESEEVHFTTYC